MNNTFYKCCAVPMCKSTSISTPQKLFIHVPKSAQIRRKWLRLARRHPASLTPTSTSYFCEDHFDLQNDMENYVEYTTMGVVSRIRMIPGCLPSKFACQPFGPSSLAITNTCRPTTVKRQRFAVINEYEKETRAAVLQQKSKNLNVEVSSQDQEDQNKEDLSGHKCNSCEDNISGFRYTCVQCESYNLCVRCETLRKHADHYMLRIPSGKSDTETERVLNRIREDLKFIEEPNDKPEENEESYIMMEALEIKQEPLPFTSPVESGTTIMQDPLSLEPETNDTQTASKRTQATTEDDTEVRPKVMKIPTLTVDESTTEKINSNNTTMTIETKQESNDPGQFSCCAASQGAVSSSSVVPVSNVEVPQTNLVRDGVEKEHNTEFYPKAMKTSSVAVDESIEENYKSKIRIE